MKRIALMIVQPYLNFDGRCEEALNFYKQALGAEIEVMMRMSEGPEEFECPPEQANQIMHACFRVGKSSIMASDCHGSGKPTFAGISLTITADSGEEATRLFNALSDGGKIDQPLCETFFASHFGVVTDRFGVSWMICVLLPQPGH
jgi:PhnB protein